MMSCTKKIIWLIVLLVGLPLAGFGIYKLYEYIVQDVTARVRQGVSEGVSKGVTDVVNPLKWPKKIFGG